MSQYTINPHGKGVVVEREGVYLGVFADKQTAQEYVIAHQNFKNSVSGRFTSPAEVLSKNDRRKSDSPA